jgi:hypothetical protein
LIGSEKTWDRGVALTSRLQTFETEMLAEEQNFASLVRINRELIGKVEAIDAQQRIVLDMDSTEIPVYGQQEHNAYNGHFESTCYHPLLLFNREGDCLVAKLRPGNVHSADDWEELSLPEIERQQKLGKEVVFRADAAFAKPEIYEALESRGVKYAIRIPANENLERDVAELLRRPAGRPSHKPIVWYKSFLYRAASWTTARRVVAKVEHHAGELFPRIGFIVINLETQSRAVVRFYNKRGTAEQWIKEGKQAVKMTRLSCHRFRSNEVRLWLSLIAYNLGNLWRRLALPEKIGTWSLTSLQQRLVKTDGRLIKHARYYWLLLAESHLTWRLFGSMLRRMEALPLPAGSARRESETSLDGRGELTGDVFEQVLRNGGNLGFFVPEAAQPGTPEALGWKRMQKIASGGKWRYIGSQPKGKTEIPAQIESFEIRWKSPISASLNAAAVLIRSHLPRQGIRQRVPLFHSPDCGYHTHPITALH